MTAALSSVAVGFQSCGRAVTELLHGRSPDPQVPGTLPAGLLVGPGRPPVQVSDGVDHLMYEMIRGHPFDSAQGPDQSRRSGGSSIGVSRSTVT